MTQTFLLPYLPSVFIALVKYLLRSLAYFLIVLPFFLLFSFKCSFYILDNRLLADLSFANIFSHSVAYLLNSLDIVIPRAEFFILMKFSVSVFFFMYHSFHVKWKNVTTKWRVIWVFSCYIPGVLYFCVLPLGLWHSFSKYFRRVYIYIYVCVCVCVYI